MISETMVLNASVVSNGVLVASVTGVLMMTKTRMVVGCLAKVFETVDLKFKGGERLFGDALPEVSSGTREESGVDVVCFLEVMAA